MLIKKLPGVVAPDLKWGLPGLPEVCAIRGISQRKLAALCGVTEATISRATRGRHLPSAKLIKKIKEVLRCSYADLYHGPTGDHEQTPCPCPMCTHGTPDNEYKNFGIRVSPEMHARLIEKGSTWARDVLARALLDDPLA